MRQIKFRAWDKEKSVLLFQDDDFAYVRTDGIDMVREGIRSPNLDVELMQFTGLFDKNGKEIYEGDIVTASFSKDFKAKIIYDDDQTSYWLEYEQEGFMKPCTQMLLKRLVLNHELEVIGNIHENPELLTKN